MSKSNGGSKKQQHTNASSRFGQVSAPGANYDNSSGNSDSRRQNEWDRRSSNAGHQRGQNNNSNNTNNNPHPTHANKTGPHGIKNPEFHAHHRLNALHNTTIPNSNFRGTESGDGKQQHRPRIFLDDGMKKGPFLNSPHHHHHHHHNHNHHSPSSSRHSSSFPPRDKRDHNHPLGQHLDSLQSRKDQQEVIITKLKSFKAELNQLESMIAAPIQDVLLHNYSIIQRLALKSKDGGAKNRNNYSKDSNNVQVLENVGGAFHALDDSLHGAKGRKAVKGTVLEGVGGDFEDPNLVGWSLPDVDGVSKQISTVYSSQPRIDPKTLPVYLQQVVFTASNQLIDSQKAAQKLLTSSLNAQKLLSDEQPPGEYIGTDANGNRLKFQKLSSDDDDYNTATTTSTSLALHNPAKKSKSTLLVIDGLHPSGPVKVRYDNEKGELLEIISLADNLPVSDAFLPPNTSMAIPTELLQAGTMGSGGGISDDTLMSVSVSVKELSRQFEKQHLEMHKKDLHKLVHQYGQKDGEKKFWAKFPLKKSKLIPKEPEIHAKFMTLLTSQHSLIKDIVSSTGYGHIQQVETRESLIQTLLQQGQDLDDHDLLLLLKQSRLVNNDIVDLRQLTLYEADTGDLLTGKDALQGVLTHMNDPSLERKHKSQLLDENCLWLNSRESIVLPYNSPDGFSDAHLPTLLRASLKGIEASFKSMTNSCTPSATAYTNMISLYGQLGLPARAATLFDEMVHDSDTVPDATTYNVMLNILAKDNKTELCLQLFDRMRQQAVDTIGFGQAEKYQSFQSVKHAEGRKVSKLKTLISHKARAMGIEDVDFSGLVELVKDDPTFKGTYLHGFDDKNKPSRDLVPRPDVVTYTTVIKALGRGKQKTSALKLFEQMRKVDGIAPNELTWTTMIDIVCDSNDFMAGLRLFHEMRTSGIKPSRATYSAMTTAAARGGEVALTSALLSEMMVAQQTNIQLYGNQSHQGINQSQLLIDAPFIGSVMRASAEGGQAPFALKLHSQLLKGQITGSGSVINPRVKNALMKKALANDTADDQSNVVTPENPNTLNQMPNAVTYNALMEVLADPASWGRTSLPPAALRIGLAVYQEALINNIFKHPYNEVQSTGIIDLRPFTRNAVLFPVHFFLNSLLGEVPVYTVDGVMPSKLSSSNHSFMSGSTTDNLDLAVQSIVQRNAPSHVVGQNPYSVVTMEDAQKGLTQVSEWSKPQETIRFPKLTVPPKGVLFICNKEVKPIWTASPEPASARFQEKNTKYIPSIEYAESVLRHTKPWLHFTRLHYGGSEGPNGQGSNPMNKDKKKTANNPNALVVAANALRLWVAEQARELGKTYPQFKVDNQPDGDDMILIEDDALSKRQQRKMNERLDKEASAVAVKSAQTATSTPRDTHKAQLDEAAAFESMMSHTPLTQIKDQPRPALRNRLKYDQLPVQDPSSGAVTFDSPKGKKLSEDKRSSKPHHTAASAAVAFASLNSGGDDDIIQMTRLPTQRGRRFGGTPKH